MPEWYGEFISKLNKGRISPNKGKTKSDEAKYRPKAARYQLSLARLKPSPTLPAWRLRTSHSSTPISIISVNVYCNAKATGVSPKILCAQLGNKPKLPQNEMLRYTNIGNSSGRNRAAAASFSPNGTALRQVASRDDAKRSCMIVL